MSCLKCGAVMEFNASKMEHWLFRERQMPTLISVPEVCGRAADPANLETGKTGSSMHGKAVW